MLSADAWSGARITRGVLGCPVCHARYPITDGVVDFTGRGSHAPPQDGVSDEGDVMRLLAQLALGEPGGVVLLTGRYARRVAELVALVDVTFILVDAPDEPELNVATFVMSERVPLADGSLRAAAVDWDRAATPYLADVVRCLRSGSRVVAPVPATPPPGVRILARDEREWVGEVETSVPVTPLRRVVR